VEVAGDLSSTVGRLESLTGPRNRYGSSPTGQDPTVTSDGYREDEFSIAAAPDELRSSSSLATCSPAPLSSWSKMCLAASCGVSSTRCGGSDSCPMRSVEVSG